jgi:hypothetical protein
MKKLPTIAVLLAVVAPEATAADLESLLRIGTAATDAQFRWGLQQADVQSLLGGEGRPGKAGTRGWIQDVALSDGECRFVIQLLGARADGALREIRLDGSAGPAETCVARASQLMSRLYVQLPMMERRAWMFVPRDGTTTSGFTTTWSWETKTTCATLSWSTAGSPSADVSISLRSTGCGPDGKNITALAPDLADIPPLDADSTWELLLRVGLNAPDPSIRWDTPLAQLQKRFAASSQGDAVDAAGTQFKLAVSDSGCQYDAKIGGQRKGMFQFIRMEQIAGPADGCRERIAAQLTRLITGRTSSV